MDIKDLKRRLKLEEKVNQTHKLQGRGRYLRAVDNDSLVVDTHKQVFYWNSRQESGDIFAWLMLLHGWSFPEAVTEAARLAGVDPASVKPRSASRQPDRPLISRYPYPLTAPSQVWQRRARRIMAQAQVRPRKSTGQAALSELVKQRGLTETTIRAAQLGFNPTDKYDPPQRWGFRRGNKIWVAAGLIIPWFIDGKLWRLRIRRPDEALQRTGGPRYVSPRVYSQQRKRQRDHEPLYNADALKAGHPAILVESEIDALTVMQEAPELAIAVATGSTGGSRRPRWLARLALASVVLIAFDADDGGDRAAQFWLDTLDNAKRWRPISKDPNQMLRDGLDVLAWVLADRKSVV